MDQPGDHGAMTVGGELLPVEDGGGFLIQNRRGLLIEDNGGSAIEDRRGLLIQNRSEEHTSELQSPCNLVCRLLLEKKKKTYMVYYVVCIILRRTCRIDVDV